MGSDQWSEVRARLEARRGEIQRDLDRIDGELQSIGVEQELENGSTGNHLADDGSSVMEQERIGTIGEDMRDVLSQIERALGRIDDGTYGTCMRCGKPIGAERLEALPYVEFCIDCQSTMERDRQLYGTAPTLS